MVTDSAEHLQLKFLLRARSDLEQNKVVYIFVYVYSTKFGSILAGGMIMTDNLYKKLPPCYTEF